MNLLEIKEIKHSIKLMDKFEAENFDFLELQNWFLAKDSKERKLKIDDTTGTYNISLLISKKRDFNRELCIHNSPSMTELRKMKGHVINLDEDYASHSLNNIICESCKIWKKDIKITLSKQILLRAQTSEDRTNYGCVWIGGGDWRPNTLYGDTTDFYIDSIILREPYKSPHQEAKELLAELRNRYDENSEFINTVMEQFKHTNQVLIHKSFGKGYIQEITKTKIKIQFDEECKIFKYPDSILQGYFNMPEINPIIIQDIFDKWNENQQLGKHINLFEYSLGSDWDCFITIRNYKNTNF